MCVHGTLDDSLVTLHTFLFVHMTSVVKRQCTSLWRGASFFCLFIYLFIFFDASTVILIFVIVVVIATVAFVVGHRCLLCVCVVIVVANC